MLSSLLREDFPELAGYVEQLVRLEERLAATWAFDHLVPLSMWEDLDSVLLVTYEDLVRSPSALLRIVLEHLNLEGDADSISNLHNAPSSTTQTDSNVALGGDPLTTWRNRLDGNEVSRILAVVERFGIDIYGADVTPIRDNLPSQPAMTLDWPGPSR